MSENQFGYTPDVDKTEHYIEQLNNMWGDDVAQLVATDDGQDTFLYRPLVYLLKQKGDAHTKERWIDKDGSLKSYSQGSIGSCVGNAEAMVLSDELAIDIIEGHVPMDIAKMVSAESCYGISREVGGMLGRGDGSYGSAAAKGSTSMGCLWQQKYSDKVDLTDYSVSTCRSFGYYGIPDSLKQTAAETKLQQSYLIKSADEAWALIGAGHPFNQCSNIGYTSTRDSDGACRRSGTWNHSMAVIGRRTTSKGRKLFLIINSWGENWVDGPLYKDQPKGSFYADFDNVASAIAQRDCFVKVSMTGIRRKKVNWEEW